MNFSGFFNTYPGMYIAQSFMHSLIAAVITDRALQLWNIGNPLIRQRDSISFRLNALFDINRWLNLELWGIIPLVWFFISIIFVATAIFLFQELIPILRHLFEPKASDFEFENSDDYPAVDE